MMRAGKTAQAMAYKRSGTYARAKAREARQTALIVGAAIASAMGALAFLAFLQHLGS